MVDNKPYRLPDPDKNPEAFLVLLYKTLKKVEYNNREWDKLYFARCMKRTKQLLECLNNDVRKASQCLQDLKDKFEGEGLSWTIETVIQYCFEWKSDFDKVNDRDMLRGLAAAYTGTGVVNIIKQPEKDRYQAPALLHEPEMSDEERLGAMEKAKECREILKKGAKEIAK
jgi:hypothetical protein